MTKKTTASAAAGGDLVWPQATGQAIADFLGFSSTWLGELVKRGYAERLPNGLFDGGAVCAGYVRFLKDDARRNSKSEMARRKDAAHCERLELANALARAEQIPMTKVEEFVAESSAILRNEIGTLPMVIARDDRELRGRIEAALDASFERAGARFRAARDGWEHGKAPAAEPDEEDEADDE